jgi:hypothetical protein
MHSGRHVARHSMRPAAGTSAHRGPRPDTRRGPRPDTRRGPRPGRRRGPGWLPVLGVCVILAAAGVGFGARTLRVQLTLGGPRPTLFGTSVSSVDALDQATAKYGHMPIVRVYYPGLPGANAWTTGLPAAAHSDVVVSFKAQPDAILSGSDDAALRHFFDTAPTGHTIYYSYYHEPEDNIAAGQFSATAYKEAWAHIVALADSAHNPSLKSTLILMAWDLSPHSGRNWKNYLPGGGIITTLGWDAYPAGSVGDKNPQLQPPSAFMGQAVAASRSAGLPFGFAEFGLATASGRPGWLSQVAAYISASGAVFGTYFDSSRWISMHLTDPASISVWRQVVQQVPVPAPSSRPSPGQSAPAGSPRLSRVRLSALTLVSSGRNHVVLRFRLSRRATVTLFVLNGANVIERELIRPNRVAGRVGIPYYGFDGHGNRVPAGRYTLLLVASNIHGSAGTEARLTIKVP